MKKEIMTPENSRWIEFTNKLADKIGEEGCSMELELAPIILEEMGDIDIEKSVEYFENNCGYCDCEILLNVDVF